MTSTSDSVLRVLYVRNLIAPRDLGGNRYPFEVVRRLAARGHDVRCVTSSALSVPGVHLTRYPVSNRSPLLTFASHAILGRLATGRSLGAWTPDVTVLSSYDNAFGFFWPRRLAPAVPTVFIYHSRFHSDAVNRVLSGSSVFRRLVALPLRPFTAAVQRMPLERCDRCVAVSDFSRREIHSFVPGADVTVISTGVDTDRFSPGDRRAAREQLGLRDSERMLLTVGRLVPVKRYDRAIRVLRVLRESGESWRLHVVGAGPEESALRALTRELGLDAHVRLEGQLDGDALVSRFRAADAQLCTSDFENWSLSLLEGLATGLPVLGTPSGGTPDLLRPIDPRMVAASFEPEDIAAGVRRLLSDGADDLRRRCHAAAQIYSWDRVVDELVALFRRTAARTRGGASL